MEDEIDLERYLQVLLKHWKIIAGITIAAVVISAGVTFLTPPAYEARVTVLRTGAAETPHGLAISPDVAADTTRTLLGIAMSQDVTASASEKLAGKLDGSERSTRALLSAVRATARGNFIDITAKSTSPQKAAAIANAWSEAYIIYTTDYYVKLLPSSEELKSQAAATLVVYKEKNEALAKFQQQVNRNNSVNCPGCAELIDNVQKLQPKLEKTSENLTLDELTIARDTARSLYMEAVSQLMNTELARKSPRPQLRLIEIAIPVDTPNNNRWMNIGIAFVLGLIAGVFAAFGLEYFDKQRRAGPANGGVESGAKQSI